jgi:hypothetical protein
MHPESSDAWSGLVATAAAVWVLAVQRPLVMKLLVLRLVVRALLASIACTV